MLQHQFLHFWLKTKSYQLESKSPTHLSVVNQLGDGFYLGTKFIFEFWKGDWAVLFGIWLTSKYFVPKSNCLVDDDDDDDGNKQTIRAGTLVLWFWQETHVAKVVGLNPSTVY